MNQVLRKTFLWMFLGLMVTFFTAYVVATNESMLYAVFGKFYFVLVIIEIVLVLVLAVRITKMSPTVARILFILYSFVTGLTFSSIFIVYEMKSVIFVFLITALLFGILAFMGYVTNADLTKLGTYLMMGLVAILISYVINIFAHNDTFEIIICSISALVFLGFTAYDVKKIEALSNTIDEDNLAIYGALQLYLDFINIFIDLLRLFGNSRD